MAEYEKKVRDILKQHGCTFSRRGKGDHDIWFSPIVNKNFPVDEKIKSRHVANAIMKQAGLAYRFR
ncbi:MAG: type II toxin-antitoxin system HicA family toxin [Oscillospiraceae bacterium]|nr:type II toxin-antitoxin system HicA family toxin [Oscillospiraceae bacterium]